MYYILSSHNSLLICVRVMLSYRKVYCCTYVSSERRVGAVERVGGVSVRRAAGSRTAPHATLQRAAAAQRGRALRRQRRAALARLRALPPR